MISSKDLLALATLIWSRRQGLGELGQPFAVPLIAVWAPKRGQSDFLGRGASLSARQLLAGDTLYLIAGAPREHVSYYADGVSSAGPNGGLPEKSGSRIADYSDVLVSQQTSSEGFPLYVWGLLINGEVITDRIFGSPEGLQSLRGIMFDRSMHGSVAPGPGGAYEEHTQVAYARGAVPSEVTQLAEDLVPHIEWLIAEHLLSGRNSTVHEAFGKGAHDSRGVILETSALEYGEDAQVSLTCRITGNSSVLGGDGGWADLGPVLQTNAVDLGQVSDHMIGVLLGRSALGVPTSRLWEVDGYLKHAFSRPAKGTSPRSALVRTVGRTAYWFTNVSTAFIDLDLSTGYGPFRRSTLSFRLCPLVNDHDAPLHLDLTGVAQSLSRIDLSSMSAGERSVVPPHATTGFARNLNNPAFLWGPTPLKGFKNPMYEGYPWDDLRELTSILYDWNCSRVEHGAQI